MVNSAHLKLLPQEYFFPKYLYRAASKYKVPIPVYLKYFSKVSHTTLAKKQVCLTYRAARWSARQ